MSIKMDYKKIQPLEVFLVVELESLLKVKVNESLVDSKKIRKPF